VETVQTLRSPASARQIFQELSTFDTAARRSRQSLYSDLEKVRVRIARAPRVDAALQVLSERMFANIVEVLKEKLSIALQEVIEQPILLEAETSYKRGAASVEFHIVRNGNPEHIMRGQGGSVANVLSVGLRMFALATLDPEKHRPFLVLDEQDCWLRPEIVPRLVKIVRQACGALGFQVLMISHHDRSLFEDYADKIYRLSPTADGGLEAVVVKNNRHDD